MSIICPPEGPLDSRTRTAVVRRLLVMSANKGKDATQYVSDFSLMMSLTHQL